MDNSTTTNYRHLVEPDFLSKRINQYYSRFPENKQHPFKTSTMTTHGIVLSSTDYLSLDGYQPLVQAQASSFLTAQNLHMSRIFVPEENDDAVMAFEKNLAEFMQGESALLCQSGWSANTSLVQAICNSDNPVYIDNKAHTSLWEGIKAADARAIPFRHNSCERLERTIKRYGPGTIIVDSVYSTQGDMAPLVELAELAQKYGCIFIVDESHALGVFGPQGEGLVVELGLVDKVHFRTSSLSKGFASRGGVIIGSRRHIDYIRYEARPLIYSSGVLAQEAKVFMATLDVIKRESWRRTKLLRNAQYLRTHLLNMGYNVTASQSHIIALEAGPAERSNQVRLALEAHGIYGALFWEPATPIGETLLRFTVTASISQDQLNAVVAACYAIRDRVQLWDWESTKQLQQQQGIRYQAPSEQHEQDDDHRVSEKVPAYLLGQQFKQAQAELVE